MKNLPATHLRDLSEAFQEVVLPGVIDEGYLETCNERTEIRDRKLGVLPRIPSFFIILLLYSSDTFETSKRRCCSSAMRCRPMFSQIIRDHLKRNEADVAHQC